MACCDSCSRRATAVNRFGTNVNQVAAAYNSTGELPGPRRYRDRVVRPGCRSPGRGGRADPGGVAVIGRVHPRGALIGGLIRYLYGPGKHEEHTNPRLVAAWQGSGDLHTLEPTTTPTGRRDVRALVALLEDPLLAADHAPAKPVWHLSLRLAPTDRTLSDAQWGHIAAEVMAHTGLARHDDPDAIRWIAVRHGPDHIHIAAILVRQDGRTETAFRDYLRARAAARDIEQRYRLHQTAPADRTAVRRPTSTETRKATRQRRSEVPRDQLRRDVRHAAAAASTEDEFFGLLQESGVIIKLRHSQHNINQVTGYAVALPDATTAGGDPIFYSGGKLAPDLSLPRLCHRWQPATGPVWSTPTNAAARGQAYAYAAEQVRTATQQMNTGSPSDDGEADAAAMAAADVLTVTARKMQGRRRGPLSRAAEALDRAARLPYGQHAQDHQHQPATTVHFPADRGNGRPRRGPEPCSPLSGSWSTWRNWPTLSPSCASPSTVCIKLARRDKLRPPCERSPPPPVAHPPPSLRICAARTGHRLGRLATGSTPSVARSLTPRW